MTDAASADSADSADPREEPTIVVPAADQVTRSLGDDLVDATLIGRGGFGTVYRAREASLDRFVAVKVLSGEFDERARSRFLREGRAMASLSGHPNIVAVHRVGVSRHGEPFLVMPYHPAGSLDSCLVDGPLPWTEAVRIGVRLAGAVAAAHHAGVLHLDIKPANVLLSEFGEPQLADFGIAKMRADVATHTVRLTASVAYAAPEVIEGHEPSTAADVYSLGSTLYALLAGRSAFAARSDESFLSQCLRVISDPVPPVAGIPSDLFEVVSLAMAKDPGVRPSAVDLGRAFQRVEQANGRRPTEMVQVASGTGGADRVAPDQPIAPPSPVLPREDGASMAASGARSHGRIAVLVGTSLLALLVAATVMVVVRGGGDGRAQGPAHLRDPRGLTVAPDGALIVADTGNHRVLRITNDGSIVAVAGTGKLGQGPDGLKAVETDLDFPSAVAYAEDGTLAIAAGGAIRLVDRKGILSSVPTPVSMPLRTLFLLRASRLGWYVAEPTRVLLVADSGEVRVMAGNDTAGFAGDGGPATDARLSGVRSLAFDTDGRLLIADAVNDRVRRIETDGTITTVYGGADPSRLESTRAEHARLSAPVGLAVGTDGTLFVTEQGVNRVRAIGSDGSVRTVAGSAAGFTAGFSGDGGPATEALFDQLGALAAHPNGSVFVIDERNDRVRRISPTGVVSTVA